MNVPLRTAGKPVNKTGAVLAGTALSLAAAAAYVHRRSRRAEQENPPRGRFIEVDGVRLHYVDRGRGEPVVLVHGNGVDLSDFDNSGLIEKVAAHHRVIAFDRPGFGYSERPRDRPWTPEDQAHLLRKALSALQVERPVLLGHSLGATVAVALALEDPAYVKALVLLAGYYYPTARPDVPLSMSLNAPLLGPLLRNTLSPLTARAMWGGARKALFSPARPPAHFDDFPVWMSLRPGQLRAAASDAGHMIPAARRLQKRYAELRMPVTLLAGEGDRVAWPDEHSRRLHGELPHSELRLVPEAGHMVHHLALEEVSAAIDAAAGRAVEQLA